MKTYLLKPLIILAVVIIGAAGLARFLLRGDTLAEYAAKNPEIATPSVVATPIDVAEVSELATSENEVIATPQPNPNTEIKRAVSNWTVEQNRTSYAPGFTKEPIGDALFYYINGTSFMEENTPVLRDDLSFLTVLHHDFAGDIRMGELICHNDIADSLLEIFHDLYKNGYQIEKIRLIETYKGDIADSMADNNTVCFYYDESSNGQTLHLSGRAICLNPFYNPRFAPGEDGVALIIPEESERYTDRTLTFPYKIDENDLAYRLFATHNFAWGGDRNNVKEYGCFSSIKD